jgi:histidine triad (HIT) family protein
MACIFCEITRKQLPAYVIWEDSQFMAFLDIHPKTAGHTLVVPKKHDSYYWEMDLDSFKKLMVAVRQVTDILRGKTQCQWVTLQIIGIDVAHVHVHLMPSSFEGMEKATLSEVAQALRLKSQNNLVE